MNTALIGLLSSNFNEIHGAKLRTLWLRKSSYGHWNRTNLSGVPEQRSAVCAQTGTNSSGFWTTPRRGQRINSNLPCAKWKEPEWPLIPQEIFSPVNCSPRRRSVHRSFDPAPRSQNKDRCQRPLKVRQKKLTTNENPADSIAEATGISDISAQPEEFSRRVAADTSLTITPFRL